MIVNRNKSNTASKARNANASSTVRRGQTQNPPRLSRQTNSQSALGAELAHAVCSITNPFCDASRGSKWPDQNAGSTLSVPIRLRRYINTDDTGTAAEIYTSVYLNGIIPGSGEDGHFVWAPAEGPDTLEFEQYRPDLNADQYRVVSAGIRVTPITSAMNSQGVINLIELPPAGTSTDYNGLDLDVKAYPSYETLPLKAQDSIYGLMRPMGPEARQFKNRDDRVHVAPEEPVYDTSDWTSLCVYVKGGAPETAVAIVDIYINFELTFKSNSGNAYLTTRTPRPSTILTNASVEVLQTTSILRGNDATVDNRFLASAWTALKETGAFVGRNIQPLFHLGAAAVQAHLGNGGAAAGHLMMMGNGGGSREID